MTWSGSRRGTKIEEARGFSWLLGPKWAFPARSGIWAGANRRGETEQTQQHRGDSLQAHHTFLALAGSPGKQEQKRTGVEKTAWQGPKLDQCRAKSSGDLKAQILGRSGATEGSPPRDSRRSSGASAQRGPGFQASRDLSLLPPHLSSARWPHRHLWPPDPRAPSHPVPSRRVFRDHRRGQCGQGAEARPVAPGLARALTFWILFSAMGQGGRRGHRPAGGSYGARGRRVSRARLVGCSAGSARGPRLAARCSLARSGRQCLLSVRPSASVRECAGGDAGKTLLFPLLLLGRSLRPPRPRPAPPGTLGSVVPALSSAVFPGLRRVTHCWLQPKPGLRTAQSWVGLCSLILINLWT